MKLNVVEHQWRRDLDLPVPDAPVPRATQFARSETAWNSWGAATHRGWAFMKEGHSRVLHYLVR